MTVGSHHDGFPMNGARQPAIHPRDERETLSALFDGELPGDAARFALKRLDHDAGWRETCGRWQLIGDALRGEATAHAPVDFAAGVMRALTAQGHRGFAVAGLPATTSGAGAPPVAAVRRRWLGGAALAASVAMAAVLAVRPWSEAADPAPHGQVAASMAPGNAVTADAASVADRPAARGPRAAAPPAPDAVATVDHPAPKPPALRGGASRPHASQPASRAAAGANEPVAALAAAPVTTGQPFHPPKDDIVARPWPRAALSDPSAGGLTVGFGSAPAPGSFYPFEPRLPAEAPPAAEPQR